MYIFDDPKKATCSLRTAELTERKSICQQVKLSVNHAFTDSISQLPYLLFSFMPASHVQAAIVIHELFIRKCVYSHWQQRVKMTLRIWLFNIMFFWKLQYCLCPNSILAIYNSFFCQFNY
jgi:hypothetical protein